MFNKKKIAVFTGTRAEYGLLYWVLKEIKSDVQLHLQLIVSGMHLSYEFGNTHEIIENDGFEIDEKIEVLLSSDSAVGVAKSMGLGVLGFADALNRLNPDLIIILGDRFEALAMAQTAMILKVPIFHLHGGELTHGAYDDAIRHAITKLSNIHGVSNEQHKSRVIQLGEEPNRVFNVGALGLEHLHRTNLLTQEQLSKKFNFDFKKPYFLVTYHPVTLHDEPPAQSFKNILDVLSSIEDQNILITYPNADNGGKQIISIIKDYQKKLGTRVFTTRSFGHINYLSAVKYSTAVVGNSSSGIIEVPSLNVPTLNVGLRQDGRLAAKSVVNVSPYETDIYNAVREIISIYKDENLNIYSNPYDAGKSSKKIIKIIKSSELSPVKHFYDFEKVGF